MTQSFAIRQIYLKDMSYQAPTGAAIFTLTRSEAGSGDSPSTSHAAA